MVTVVPRGRRNIVLLGLLTTIALVPFAGGAAPADPLAPSGRFSVYQSAAALTPPMGWNPWNAFRTDVDEAKIRGSAQALVDTGLAARGYRYVNMDDGWALQRLPDGTIRIRDSMFPSAKVHGSVAGSLKPFTDFIHGLGLKAGLYTDIGRNTCAQRMGGRALPALAALTGQGAPGSLRLQCFAKIRRQRMSGYRTARATRKLRCGSPQARRTFSTCSCAVQRAIPMSIPIPVLPRCARSVRVCRVAGQPA
jgi:hypothetical protein